MENFEIKNRWNGKLIFEAKAVLTMKICIELAIKNNADLRGADLRGANLYGTKF